MNSELTKFFRLFESTYWDATKEERDILSKKTEKIYITPECRIGLRGLINIGSTCFMNCNVQVLMHTPFLRDYFLTERHRCNRHPGTCAVCEVSKLFQVKVYRLHMKKFFLLTCRSFMVELLCHWLFQNCCI